MPAMNVANMWHSLTTFVKHSMSPYRAFRNSPWLEDVCGVKQEHVISDREVLG